MYFRYVYSVQIWGNDAKGGNDLCLPLDCCERALGEAGSTLGLMKGGAHDHRDSSAIQPQSELQEEEGEEKGGGSYNHIQPICLTKSKTNPKARFKLLMDVLHSDTVTWSKTGLPLNTNLNKH